MTDFNDQWEEANTLAILRLQALQAQLEDTENALECVHAENLRLLSDNVRNRGILRGIQEACEHVPTVWFSHEEHRDKLTCERCRMDLDEDEGAQRLWLMRLANNDPEATQSFERAAIDEALANLMKRVDSTSTDLKGLSVFFNQPNENEEP